MTRVFADEAGVTHFDEHEIPLTDAGAIGALSEPWRVDGVIFRSNDPGYDYDWHPAPRRQLVVLLDGEIEIEVGDGETRRFRGGDVLLLEDTSGRGHRTRTVSDRPRRSLFVALEHAGKPYELTAAELGTGISHCRTNAHRLLVEASAILDHGGRTGSAYVFWSVAVEEYGKAIILEQLAVGRADTDPVSVPQKLFRGDHERKFKEGFTRIQDTVGSTFGNAVVVLQNAANRTVTIRHPAVPSVTLPVGGGATGEISDDRPGEPASHRLRFALLYVDWDDSQRVWRQPEAELTIHGLVGHWTISRVDLERAIGALRDELLGGEPSRGGAD